MPKKLQKVPFIRHYSGTYAYYVKVRRRKWMMRIVRVLLIAALLCVGYFLTKTLLLVSLLPPA